MNIRYWAWEQVGSSDLFTVWIQKQWSKFKNLYGDSLYFSAKEWEKGVRPDPNDPREDPYSPDYAGHVNYRYHERFDQWLFDQHDLDLNAAKANRNQAVADMIAAPMDQNILTFLKKFGWKEDVLIAQELLHDFVVKKIYNTAQLVQVANWINEHTIFNAKTNYRALRVEFFF